MSRYLMRYVIEHDGELVGAFCRNKNHIGKDVAEIIGNGFPTVGVKVEDSATADARIGELKPDVCIIATCSTVAELEDIFTICAKHGVNAITTCEEALYLQLLPLSPQSLTSSPRKATAPSLASATATSIGALWLQNLAGSSHKITKIDAAGITSRTTA